MGAFGSKNLEYYNYASMKLLEVENYENDEELYFKEHDIDEIIKKARDIRNCNYKESLDLYFKALKILKKLKDNNNNNKIYKNILEFEIRPQELKNKSIKLNTHCIKHNDHNNKDRSCKKFGVYSSSFMSSSSYIISFSSCVISRRCFFFLFFS